MKGYRDPKKAFHSDQYSGAVCVSLHPQRINLPLMPSIDPNWVIYTGSYSGLKLWAINPAGSTG